MNIADNSHLILKHCATKRPDASEYEVQFIKIFWAVRRSVFRSEKCFEKVAQHLYHTLLRYRNDGLKSNKVMNLYKMKLWYHI